MAGVNDAPATSAIIATFAINLPDFILLPSVMNH